VVSIAVLTCLAMTLTPFLAEGARGWLGRADPFEPGDTAVDMDEFVTIATYDQLLDAHIARGRLSAEGIETQLFDEQMVMYAIALGGIKLRVTRGDEKVARRVLETDYSAALDDVDLGSRRD
jgi:hypothetical protein